MNYRLRSLLPTLALLGVAFSSTAWPAFAQDPSSDPGQAEQAANAENADAQNDGAEDDATEKSLREQNIYIPYEKLRGVFEKHGRGVFLPYEKFQELWQSAREKTEIPAEDQPPVGALITEIENEATVSKDVVRVKALLKIELLAEGWHEVPLRLASAAITAATLGDEPARIIQAADQDYRLLVHKKGKQPEQIELALEYAKAIERTPGQNSVEFQSPQAPVSRWRVRIPQSGVKVNIHPLIAATEVPEGEGEGGDEEGADENAQQPDETVVLAFVGATPLVRIEWTPKAEGATGLAALASVQAEQQVTIDEGVTRTRTVLDYSISRAELDTLSIEVPADQKVVDVLDDNVRQWSVERVDDRQQITVQLHVAAKQSQPVTVQLEQFSDGQPQDSITVPVVRALGVGRQQGVLVVQIADGLRADAARTSGLLQLDAAELPDSLKRRKWDFSYRYATAAFDLQMSIEKVQPEIVVDSLVEAYLQPEQLSLNLLAVYTIERAGVFRLELDLPAGYEVRGVYGRKAANAAAVQVDSHHLAGDDDTRLVVNLSRKARGRVALAVDLEKDLDQPDLRIPTGNKVPIALSIPRVVPVAPEVIRQDSGRLIVFAPESLEVSPQQAEGLREISFQEAMQGMEPARSSRPSDMRPVLERAFTREKVTLELSVKRRKPKVTIRQLLVARIDNGMVRYEATFFYDVLYSGVKSLRIDVPKPPADAPAGEALRWRNVTDGISDSVIEAPEIEPAEGYEAWSFAGKTELLGQGKIELELEEKIDEAGLAEGVDLVLPRLKPMEVDQAWGQIVLAKAETIDIQPQDPPAVLLPIDHQQDLITKVDDAARAFEFHDDWELAVRATQYELKEIKRTSIERAVVRMVVTRAGQVPVQALYRIRSARQRLEIRLPAGAVFDTDPVRINGRPVGLQGGNQPDTYYVPLVGSDAKESFLLEFRYMVPDYDGQLALPVFADDPAVQKVYLCAYLPREWALLGTSGSWTQEFRWLLNPSLNWMPIARPNAENLVAQVVEGVEGLTRDPAESFETDGLLYVFSTLRPRCPGKHGASDAGSLKLRTTSEIWLGVIVFVATVIGGLLLLPRTTSDRALAIGVLIVALVLSGVFLPTFSLQVLDGVLMSAIFIVLVVWTVWFFVKTVPAAMARSRAMRPPSPPPPPVQGEAVDNERPEPAGDEQAEEGGKTDA